MAKTNFYTIYGLHPGLWGGYTVSEKTLRELRAKGALGKWDTVRPVKKKPKKSPKPKK